MIALLSAERIKLFSTGSPYCYLVGTVLAALLFAVMQGAINDGRDATIDVSQGGLLVGMILLMVMAAQMVTGEYRFGTIRSTFRATPRPGRVLAAKTIIAATIAAATAAVSGPAAFFVMKAIANDPRQPLALASGTDWRVVTGSAAIFALAAIIATAVAVLVRHTAATITLLVAWPLLIGTLIELIPTVGRDISRWMPFIASGQFISTDATRRIGQHVTAPAAPTPLQGLLILAGTAAVLWVAALLVFRRRDV